MSDEEYVWKSRSTTYHEDRECIGLTNKDIQVKRIRKSVAEAWELQPCSNCVLGQRERVGHSEWSDFVNKVRHGDN